MTYVDTRKVASKEMQQFIAKVKLDEMDKYGYDPDAYAKVQNKKKTLATKLRQATDAAIGFGVALSRIENEMAELEKEINELKPPSNLQTIIEAEFQKKFGIPYYSINWTPPTNTNLDTKEGE